MRKGGGQVSGEEGDKEEEAKGDEEVERSRLGGGGEMAGHGRSRSPVRSVKERTIVLKYP